MRRNCFSFNLEGKNITEISNSSFSEIEQLEKLELSNNNNEELNAFEFHNALTRTN